jgi:hypothetical protein
MTFTRTDQGLSNQSKFLGTDEVVYVEGGPESFSIDEVLAGFHSDVSLDISFWQVIFDFFRPDKKYAFRAVGSKSVLIKLAEKLESGHIRNVAVAMDRDLDSYQKVQIDAPSVYYTWGYSWENDVWNLAQVENVFFAICPVSRAGSPYSEQLSKRLKEFCDATCRCVTVDVLFAMLGEVFLPKDSGHRIVELVAQNEPRANKPYMKSLLQDLSTRRGAGAARKALPEKLTTRVDVWRDCQGHIVATFCYRLVSYLRNRAGLDGLLRKDQVHLAAIQEFKARLSSQALAPWREHYAAQFGRASGAAAA